MVNYSVIVTVKDEKGLQLIESDGSKRSDMSFDVMLNAGGEESYLRQTAKTFGAWAPNRRIKISLYVRNSAASTFFRNTCNSTIWKIFQILIWNCHNCFLYLCYEPNGTTA